MPYTHTHTPPGFRLKTDGPRRSGKWEETSFIQRRKEEVDLLLRRQRSFMFNKKLCRKETNYLSATQLIAVQRWMNVYCHWAYEINRSNMMIIIFWPICTWSACPTRPDWCPAPWDSAVPPALRGWRLLDQPDQGSFWTFPGRSRRSWRRCRCNTWREGRPGGSRTRRRPDAKYLFVIHTNLL